MLRRTWWIWGLGVCLLGASCKREAPPPKVAPAGTAAAPVAPAPPSPPPPPELGVPLDAFVQARVLAARALAALDAGLHALGQFVERLIDLAQRVLVHADRAQQAFARFLCLRLPQPQHLL